jgi:hypothetical protein
MMAALLVMLVQEAPPSSVPAFEEVRAVTLPGQIRPQATRLRGDGIIVLDAATRGLWAWTLADGWQVMGVPSAGPLADVMVAGSAAWALDYDNRIWVLGDRAGEPAEPVGPAQPAEVLALGYLAGPVVVSARVDGTWVQDMQQEDEWPGTGSSLRLSRQQFVRVRMGSPAEHFLVLEVVLPTSEGRTEERRICRDDNRALIEAEWTVVRSGILGDGAMGLRPLAMMGGLFLQTWVDIRSGSRSLMLRDKRGVTLDELPIVGISTIVDLDLSRRHALAVERSEQIVLRVLRW